MDSLTTSPISNFTCTSSLNGWNLYFFQYHPGLSIFSSCDFSTSNHKLWATYKHLLAIWSKCFVHRSQHMDWGFPLSTRNFQAEFYPDRYGTNNTKSITKRMPTKYMELWGTKNQAQSSPITRMCWCFVSCAGERLI